MPPALPLADQLLAMASGAWVTQMIHVAAELGLAANCGADGDALLRLLRGLASLGIFEETAPRRFGLTPLAELLRSVRTGENAFRHRHGCSVFEWYERHPERGAIFAGAMGDLSRPETEAVLAAFDFSAIRHLVDVGGGLSLRRIHPTASAVSVVEAVAG